MSEQGPKGLSISPKVGKSLKMGKWRGLQLRQNDAYWALKALLYSRGHLESPTPHAWPL